MIIASMSTIPIRRDSFKKTVRSILTGQTCPVDRLHVFLYHYGQIDPDLPQDPRLEYHLEYPEAGPWVRYVIADRLQKQDVLVTLDDDMVYPPNYVEMGLHELSRYRHEAVVCFGGICWDPLVERFSYGSDRWHSVPETMLDSPRRVSLLMGMLSFFPVWTVQGAIKFPLRGFETNDDMMIGYALQNRAVSTWCCPKPALWIREQETARATHALFRRDAATRHSTFDRMVTELGFDPTAGRLTEFVSKPNRVLVVAGVCPPLASSERLDEHLRTQCREDTGVHLVAPVPASQAGTVQKYVDVPYHIHAVTVPEPGGRLDNFGAVRAWRSYRVNLSTPRLVQARVNAAIRKLVPTAISEWDQTHQKLSGSSRA